MVPSNPRKVVVVLALLLAVWGAAFWLHRPTDVDLSGSPITTGPRGVSFQPSSPPLVAVDLGSRNQPSVVEPLMRDVPTMRVPAVLGENGAPKPIPSPTPVRRTVNILPEFSEYTVQKGDVSFGAIARRVYGDSKWGDSVARANPFVTPNKLIVGRTVLRIAKDPTNIQGKVVTLGQADAPLATPAWGEKASPAGGAMSGASKTYVTQPGDTLSGISKKFYGKATLYQKIIEANPGVLSDPAKLKAGLELVIPE